MRILFVINNLGLMDPAGIAYLSAIAGEFGHERYLCILHNQDITKRIQEVKPDVIAYSLNSCEADEVFEVHRQLVKPTGIFSIMGGPHPTFYPESFEKSGVDAYCIGEGELVFANVLRTLSKGGNIDTLNGIKTKTKSNPLEGLAYLDSLPMPDRDLILGSTFLAGFPRKTFLTSRGCPYSCAYCFNPTLRDMYRGNGTWMRRFSVDRVIREITDVRSKYRLNFVKFDDDNFALGGTGWLEEFSYKYRKEVGLPFNCLLRLENATDAVLRPLKNAGCHSITTSIDSSNEQIRKEILRRNIRIVHNEELAEALLRIKEYGIHVFVNYITGVPTATAEDELNSIKMNQAGKITYANYTTLTPFHGTAIWNYCNSRGLYNNTNIPQSLMKPTLLAGFTLQEKRVQRNVLLLGAFGCVLPHWLMLCLAWMVQIIPPNRLFILMYSLLKSHQISNKIYPTKANWLDKLKVTLRATVNDFKEIRA